MRALLILKRARASRPSGQWQDEDYDVLADGKVIGRILEEGSRFGPPEFAVEMVDHVDRAGVACPRPPPRRSIKEGQVSRELDEGPKQATERRCEILVTRSMHVGRSISGKRGSE
jgi:hypothetical protein